MKKVKLPKLAYTIFSVIARLFMCAGIMIWFIISIFGWIVPIALQNDGCSAMLQLISFAGWLTISAIGIYRLAKVANISF